MVQTRYIWAVALCLGIILFPSCHSNIEPPPPDPKPAPAPAVTPKPTAGRIEVIQVTDTYCDSFMDILDLISRNHIKKDLPVEQLYVNALSFVVQDAAQWSHLAYLQGQKIAFETVSEDRKCEGFEVLADLLKASPKVKEELEAEDNFKKYSTEEQVQLVSQWAQRVIYRRAFIALMPTLDIAARYIPPTSDDSSQYGLGIDYAYRSTQQFGKMPSEVEVTYIQSCSPFAVDGLAETVDVGDKIVQIDDKPVGELTAVEFESLIWSRVAQGKSPEELTVQYLKRGAADGAEATELKVTPSRCSRDGFYHLDLGDDIYYFKLRTFSNPLEGDFVGRLSALSDKMRWMILDLRNNGGGSTAVSDELVDALIGQGEYLRTYDQQDPWTWTRTLAEAIPDSVNKVVKEEGRGEMYITVQSAEVAGAISHSPMVVLVDELSASASEILVGVFSAFGRAIIVGDTTFGKSISQSVYRIQAQSHRHKSLGGTIRFTSGYFYVPYNNVRNHHLQGHGVGRYSGDDASVEKRGNIDLFLQEPGYSEARDAYFADEQNSNFFYYARDTQLTLEGPVDLLFDNEDPAPFVYELDGQSYSGEVHFNAVDAMRLKMDELKAGEDCALVADYTLCMVLQSIPSYTSSVIPSPGS